MVNSADTRLKSGLKLPTDVSDPVIVVNQLTKDYVSGAGKVRALDHISIGIARRRFTAIMGPSGSGKSTFMHCLAGFESATSGAIEIDGTEIVGMNQRRLTRLRRDHIGFIFQAFNLIPTLSAKENIVLPFEISRRKVPQERFEQVIAALGLEDRLKHRPSELSGGQQQRVACARALLQDAVVLFADEPTGNLDSESSKQVLCYLRKAVNDFGQSVVMVTHEAAAAAYADRVLFLSDGKIVAELDHPERESVLAAQTELPQFMAAHPLPKSADELTQTEKTPQPSAAFLPAGSKSGAWPNREKMQARLANLQVARGAQIEVPASPAAPTPVGGIDAGALNALMGAGKPVVPPELRTKEGARRVLAQTRESMPKDPKVSPQVKPVTTSSDPATNKPSAPQEPTTRLQGSVWETRDERGTTWQGWTPKPGHKTEKATKPRPRLSAKTANLPEPYRLARPGTAAKNKPTASHSTSSNKAETPAGKSPVPSKTKTIPPHKPEPSSLPSTSIEKDSAQKNEDQRWSKLYSVFSDSITETEGFWEETRETRENPEKSPADKNQAHSGKKQVRTAGKNSLTPGKTSTRNPGIGSQRKAESTFAKTSNTEVAKFDRSSDLPAKTGNKLSDREKSRPIPRTPEETLSQEKQRLLAMIKKAEALLGSSQDAIASFQDPQDKA